MSSQPTRQERRLAARQTAKELLAPESNAPKNVREVLAAEAPQVLRRIPLREQEILGQLPIVATQTTITRSGPLPPAEELLEYDNVIPGSAERLLKMAENQSGHRIEMERLLITSQQQQSARGQTYGLIIGLAGILTGAALAYLGHDWVGGTIAGTTVTGLVSVFVIGKAQQAKNLSEKKPR